jgi:hypothetical protein
MSTWMILRWRDEVRAWSSVSSVTWSGRVFLDAAGDDLERSIRKRPLQLQGLVQRGRHPGLGFVRRRQDHRHRLWVDSVDLGVRLGREEREDVIGGLAFLHFPDGRPVGPDAGEAGEGAALIEREPDVAASALLNSLKELNGTTQRFSAPSHLVQCLLY